MPPLRKHRNKRVKTERAATCRPYGRNHRAFLSWEGSDLFGARRTCIMLYQKGLRVRARAYLFPNGELVLQNRGGDMTKKRRRKSPKRRSGKITFPKVNLLAATLYWTVRLILLIWDRLTR